MTRLLLIAVLAASLSAGCTWVEQRDENTIRISIGQLGEIAPGLRRIIGWPEAELHCQQFGKSASLIDLDGKTAVWRCVADD